MNDKNRGADPGVDPEADSSAIGYFAVAIPKLDFFQGFFLPRGLEAEADAFTELVYREIGGRYVPPSAVVTPWRGQDDEREPYIGAMSSALVEFVVIAQQDRTGDPLRFGAVAKCGVALSRLIGLNYFWISAEQTRSGTNTKLQRFPMIRKDLFLGLLPPVPVPVSSPAEARQVIDTIPEIMAIRSRRSLDLKGNKDPLRWKR